MDDDSTRSSFAEDIERPKEPYRLSTPAEREEAIGRITRGEKIKDVAEAIGFKPKTVTKWWKTHLEEKSGCKQEKKPRPKYVHSTPEQDKNLVRMVQRYPDMDLKEVMRLAGFPCGEQTAKKKLKAAGIIIRTITTLVLRDDVDRPGPSGRK